MLGLDDIIHTKEKAYVVFKTLIREKCGRQSRTIIP